MNLLIYYVHIDSWCKNLLFIGFLIKNHELNVDYIFRSLYHEKFTEAEAAAQRILVMDKWEGYLRLAEVYFYRQDYAEADNCVELLLNQYESDNSYQFSDR